MTQIIDREQRSKSGLKNYLVVLVVLVFLVKYMLMMQFSYSLWMYHLILVELQF